jgi:hypothetical protein
MATTIESRTAGRSLPQPSDLLLVQRGSTPYRATADEVKAFMLSPATAAAIGAIKPGTNLSVDADGTLHAAISGPSPTEVRLTPLPARPLLALQSGMSIWPVRAVLPWPAGRALLVSRSPRGTCCYLTAAAGAPTPPWAPMALA